MIQLAANATSGELTVDDKLCPLPFGRSLFIFAAAPFQAILWRAANPD